jgi:hypothetical protein
VFGIEKSIEKSDGSFISDGDHDNHYNDRLGHLAAVAINGIALTCRPVDPARHLN